MAYNQNKHAYINYQFTLQNLSLTHISSVVEHTLGKRLFRSPKFTVTMPVAKSS